MHVLWQVTAEMGLSATFIQFVSTEVSAVLCQLIVPSPISEVSDRL